MIKISNIIISILILFSLNINTIKCDNIYSRSIFVNRQLSYNPVIENSQTLSIKRTLRRKNGNKKPEIISQINNAKKILDTKNEEKNICINKFDTYKLDIDQNVIAKNVIISHEQKDKEFRQAEYLLSKIIDPFSLNEKSIDIKSKQSKNIISSPKDFINKKIIEARNKAKLIEKKKKIIEIVTKITQEIPIQEIINYKQKPDSTEIKNLATQEEKKQNEPETKKSEIQTIENKITQPIQEIITQEKQLSQEKIISPILEPSIKQEIINTEKLRINCKNVNYIFAIKPIYTQNIGSRFQKYFNINHKCTLSVKQNGSGDIDPLWFDVKGADNSFYNSILSFNPKRQTYGSILYFAASMPHNLEISINTAILQASNNINICEIINTQNLCTTCTTGYQTITQSFASSSRLFNKICGTQTKTGLDDIQIKLSYAPAQIKINNTHSRSINLNSLQQDSVDSKENYDSNEQVCQPKYLTYELYGLLGIPTGSGSKAKYLFEPLIGSKHAQLGFGATMQCNIAKNDFTTWSLLSEFKYRYAFAAKEYRSFDLLNNCQWSRYMLFVNESDKYATYPAINDLTFNVKVNPGNSIDFYIATHIEHCSWNLELGYDVWYRSPEKINFCCQNLPNVGIADLKGIAANNPQSAHVSNISQSITTGNNQMVSDAKFIPITLRDINCLSGSMESSLSNSFYGSIGYTFETKSDNKISLGANACYERGCYIDSPDNVSTWLNLDFNF